MLLANALFFIAPALHRTAKAQRPDLIPPTDLVLQEKT